SATSSITPSPPATLARPRSSTTRCGLSAPRAMPAAANTTAARIRNIRIARGRRRGIRALLLGRQGNDRGHPLAQVLAGLEMGNVLARQRHRVAGLGVAAGGGRTAVQREGAEHTGGE